jgi:hypothetical protein
VGGIENWLGYYMGKEANMHMWLARDGRSAEKVPNGSVYAPTTVQNTTKTILYRCVESLVLRKEMCR